ncbi:MAG: 50S ribosomal protein L21 [Capsulimonadaceae bacterium]
MYAIVRSGGKQYRVEEAAVVTVDRLSGEAGDSVTLEEVLFVGGESPKWGAPLLPGASVTATIVAQAKGKKIDGFIYKAKKNVRKHWGHRQQLTRLKIESIQG